MRVPEVLKSNFKFRTLIHKLDVYVLFSEIRKKTKKNSKKLIYFLGYAKVLQKIELKSIKRGKNLKKNCVKAILLSHKKRLVFNFVVIIFS